MSFLNNPDIQDDGQGNVNIQKSDGGAAHLNVTGATTGTWFSFNNMQNNGNTTIIFQNKDGKTPASIFVTGTAQISQTLTVSNTFTASGVSNLNGKTNINSQADNFPLHITGLGGQFWFFSSGGQNNGAVIRGGSQSSYGIVFTGTDRVRIEGIGGDNRAATLQDLANITFMQNAGLMNAQMGLGFNG